VSGRPSPIDVAVPPVRRRRLLLALGFSYALYLGVIIYSDVWRPQDLGIKLEYGAGDVYVAHVVPGSPAQVAGLQVGDRVSRLGSVHLRTRLDRLAFHPRLRFEEPIPVTWLRTGAEMHSTMTVSLGDPAFWSTRAGFTLALMRAVQIAMLALAFVIAWKQPQDSGAFIGAWLLASLAVYNIVLPARLPGVWRDLPVPLEAALWLPYLSSISAGAILATFYTVFPQKGPRWKLILGAVWGLTLPLLALGVYDQLQVQYAPHTVPLPTAMTWLNTPATLLLVALGACVMVGNYRRLSSETERRRVRLVLGSSCAACLSAGAAATYWAASPRADLTTGLFSSWALTLGMLPTILVPFSFAYAITRHRLFDISLILRRGLQYALARRFLLSLIPAVALVFLVDVYTHPRAPGGGLRERVWWYAGLLAAAVWIYRRRADWLEALDRRYFREQYSAQKLLRELAGDLEKATQLEDLLPAVARRIEAALHPKYVALLLRSHDGRFYESVDRTEPPPHTLRFSAGDKAIRLLAVLGRPLVVGSGAPRSVFDELPEDERRALVALETELLVAIAGPGDTVEALLALGMKRSEEPFSSEDLDLLTAVAMNLKSLLPRSATSEECDACGASYATGTGRCTTDGTVLVPSETPTLLAARYAIERRLGRGGMGTVYAARDLQLNRPVAVKLLRERLESAPAVDRCRREARAAAALAHPNVVTIYDMGLTSDGRPFLVMELLRGGTLRDALSGGPLAPNRIGDLFEGICAALDAAHAQGLVHRDLKPENVFLVSGARDSASVKLLDFGISTFIHDARTGPRSGVLGTPEYAAPEQIRGEVPAASWDVWALSVMAFEAVVGMRPVACVSLALAGQLSPGDTGWNDPALRRLTPPLATVFGRALSLDPAERPPSPSVFLERLQEALR
jgi:eukaryotic-like serine/threonine-protein kinase